MIKYYLKTYLKQAKKNKTTYLITIGGFSLSLAIAMLFSSYVLEELSFNKSYSRIDNLYGIVDSKNDASVEEIDKSSYYQISEIKNVTRYFPYDQCNVRFENIKTRAKLLLCDEEFFEMFDVNLLAGQFVNVFEHKKNVVITTEFATRMFGNENALGKNIALEGDTDFIIAAVAESLPNNCSFDTEIFCNVETRLRQSSASFDDHEIMYSRYLLELNDRVNLLTAENKINALWLSKKTNYSKDVDYKLYPFADSYIGQVYRNDFLKHANSDLIYLISGIVIIVLLLSTLNYTNLSIANNLSRSKEFGIKKTAGADKVEIFSQILFESFFNIIISVSIGLLLLPTLNYVFEPLLNRSVDYLIVFSHSFLVGAFILAILILTFNVGIYPSYHASKSKTISLLTFKVSSKEGSFLKNIISTFQFSVTAILIVALIVVHQQSEHLKTKDLGFNTDLLLKLDVHHKVKEGANIVKRKLLSNPNIISVTNTHSVPGQINMMISGTGYKTQLMMGDIDFLRTFQIELKEGRNFTEGERSSCLVNEKFLKDNNVEDWRKFEPYGKTIGVVKDFKQNKLYEESNSLVIAFAQDEFTNISIKIKPNKIHATLKFIEETWNEVLPNEPFLYSFYDDWIDSMYKKEERQADIIKIFTIIAIFIALMGLYGMTELSVAKKIKEFGIRKVFGAGTSDIFILQNKGTLKWNLLAIVLSIPISYYLLSKWLEGYVHRIEICWEVYLICAVLILALSIITTSYRVITSARNNPVESLRNE